MLRLSFATPDDLPVVLSFIRKLAEYERLTDKVVATEELLRTALFGERPAAEVILARIDGSPIGFALFFQTFSTFVGRPGIYLEDLFVDEEHRGKGIGKALLVELAKITRERGCRRLEWSVLNWNTPSIEFYKSLGATPMNEWTIFRVADNALERLAEARASGVSG